MKCPQEVTAEVIGIQNRHMKKGQILHFGRALDI
jgi:hypothetical protein